RRVGLLGKVALSGFALLSAAALPSLFAACSTPSSTLDGGDLMGVYSAKDAASDAALDARSSKDGGRKDAGAASPGPPKERRPVTGTCVAKQGEADHELRRTLGRPACRDEVVLEARDADGSPRYACLMAKGAEARAPLPLVVFFHGPQ